MDEPKTLVYEPRTQVDLAHGPTQISDDSWEPAPVALDGTGLEIEGFAERYEKRKSLGSGGMGEVKLFRDQRIGREVAVKVSHTGETAPARERFLREARITAQLEHPSIVPVYDMGVGPDGEPYFTMKRVRGLTLEAILDGLAEGAPEIVERFSQRKLLIAFSHICLAMAYAHERGVLHRDIKPANVMLGDFGEVYVLDWGLAKVAGSEEVDGVIALDLDLEEAIQMGSGGRAATIEGSVLGTPGYMAPEQVRGEVAKMDARTDVWALGSLLFELLTLQPLLQAPTPQAAMLATLAPVEARPSVRAPDLEIAPELEAICVRATARASEDRFQSARTLHDAMERFLEGDRDLELRREMAQVHAERAQVATEQALSGDGVSEDARRDALKALGRALALDPQNAQAVQSMARLLLEPPREMPDAVREELEASKGAQIVLANRKGSPVFWATYAFFPLMLWMGIRDWSLVIGMGVAFGGAHLLTYLVGRYQWRSMALQLGAFTLSMVGLALCSRILGPLVLVPTAVVGFAMSYALIQDRTMRLGFILVAALAMCGPLALELLGVLSASYVFSQEGMLIVPHALDLPEGASLMMLVTASLGLLITPSLFLGSIRTLLDASERRLVMQSWQLRQLVPEEAASALEPPHALPESAPLCQIGELTEALTRKSRSPGHNPP